jgi:hypothetical protein
MTFWRKSIANERYLPQFGSLRHNSGIERHPKELILGTVVFKPEFGARRCGGDPD